VDIPVTAAGRLDPDAADKAVADGKCDFVAMGRKLLADPDLPIKLQENRTADVRPCIYCYACVSQIFVNERVKCAVNPQTGHESELQLIASDSPKKVLVVGGGPAGLEAARVAALRGHQVTLVERSGRLGGTLFFAALAYPENGALLDYLIKQVRDLPIDIRLNTHADEALVNALKPDQVIVAVGARRNAPDIPGADQKHVWSGDELRKLMTGEGADIAKRKLNVTQRMMMKSGSLVGVTNSTEAMQSLSKLWMPLGKNVTIIGGGLVGLELAEFLVERGRNVHVLEPGPDLGAELSIVRRWKVLHNLESHGVRMEKNTQVHTIGKKSVNYSDAEGNCHELAADSVVLAIGADTNNCLSRCLEKQGIEVVNIGDGAEVAYIEGALKSGMKAAIEA
jgi:NADPH-dependent 2,4-dienoyl-CoA reductase/sulfur reductase-like enzyme